MSSGQLYAERDNVAPRPTPRTSPDSLDGIQYPSSGAAIDFWETHERTISTKKRFLDAALACWAAFVAMLGALRPCVCTMLIAERNSTFQSPRPGP